MRDRAGLLVLLLGACRADDVHIHTPLLRSSQLSQLVGGTVHLKMDALQPGGSFKARGIGRLCAHFREQGVTSLISSSCANAGMAVAVAGRALGIDATIVASEVDHECRLLDEFKRLGAKVVLHGSEWNSADAHARELGEKDGCAYVEMFDHPLIFDGHASLVHELYADRKGVPPSCIVLSVGGGGLLSGVCTGLKQVGWTSVPIFACQSERCNLLDAALKAGGTPTPTHIFSADGHDLGTRTVAQQAVDFARECDVRSLLVSDADTLETVARFADDERILVEPLCAVALAALYTQPDVFKGFDEVVVIVCGGSLTSLDDAAKWRKMAAAKKKRGPPALQVAVRFVLAGAAATIVASVLHAAHALDRQTAPTA